MRKRSRKKQVEEARQTQAQAPCGKGVQREANVLKNYTFTISRGSPNASAGSMWKGRAKGGERIKKLHLHNKQIAKITPFVFYF